MLVFLRLVFSTVLCFAEWVVLRVLSESASDIVCPFNVESILDRSNQQDLWFLVSVMSHILLGQTTCISLATCGMKWRPCLLSLLQSWVCISWIGCPSPSLLSLCIHVPLILLLISMQQSMGWSTPWNIRLYMISTDNPLRGSYEHRLQKRYLLLLVSQVVLVVQSRFLQVPENAPWATMARALLIVAGRNWQLPLSAKHVNENIFSLHTPAWFQMSSTTKPIACWMDHHCLARQHIT